MVVEHRREPGPGFGAVRVQDNDVELGVVSLPSRVRPFGPVAMHQLIAVPERGRALVRERQHGGIEPADDRVDAPIRRCLPSPVGCDRADAPMDRGGRQPRLGKCHALDQRDQLAGQLSRARVGSRLSREAGWPVGAVARHPTPNGAERNSSIRCHACQRHFAVQIRTEQGEPLGGFGHSSGVTHEKL